MYLFKTHSAKGGNEQKIYTLDLEFYQEVVPEVGHCEFSFVRDISVYGQIIS